MNEDKKCKFGVFEYQEVLRFVMFVGWFLGSFVGMFLSVLIR